MSAGVEQTAAIEAERGAPQLTLRAAVVGALVGLVMCLVNLSLALRTGFSVGSAATAALIGFAAFRAKNAVRKGGALTLLENMTIGSIGASAGFITGGGNLAMLGALTLLEGHVPDFAWCATWFIALAALGILLAIPQRARVDRATFPSGTAAAETLRAIHGGRVRTLGRALGVTLGVSAGATAIRDLVAARLQVRATLLAVPSPWNARFSDLAIGVETSPLLLGVGALMGGKTAGSMLLGSALSYLAIAPRVESPASYRALTALAAWPSTALLVAASLGAVAFDLRASRAERAIAATSPPRDRSPRAFGRYVVALPAAVVVASMLVVVGGLPILHSIAVVVAACLATDLAARAIGETDTAPTKSLGVVAQTSLRAAIDAPLRSLLLGASAVAGVALHAADMLTDFKTGRLLGADPRQQVRAQLIGVSLGAIFVLPMFALIVGDGHLLGTDRMRAPSVIVWAELARTLAAQGGGVPPSMRALTIAAIILGLVLATAAHLSPRAKRWLPSAAAMSIGMILPPSATITIALGAAVASIARARRGESDGAIASIASGAIAGESLAQWLGTIGTALAAWLGSRG